MRTTLALDDDLLAKARDSMLTHCLDISGIDRPTLNEILEVLHVISEAVGYAQLVFHGTAVSWENDLKIRTKKANQFWDLCQVGFES